MKRRVYIDEDNGDFYFNNFSESMAVDVFKWA